MSSCSPVLLRWLPSLALHAQEQDTARAEQQKQQRVDTLLLPCAPAILTLSASSGLGDDSCAVLSTSSGPSEARIWRMCRRRRCLKLRKESSGCPEWAAVSMSRA